MAEGVTSTGMAANCRYMLRVVVGGNAELLGGGFFPRPTNKSFDRRDGRR